jgi:hypothetical protein
MTGCTIVRQFASVTIGPPKYCSVMFCQAIDKCQESYVHFLYACCCCPKCLLLETVISQTNYRDIVSRILNKHWNEFCPLTCMRALFVAWQRSCTRMSYLLDCFWKNEWLSFKIHRIKSQTWHPVIFPLSQTEKNIFQVIATRVEIYFGWPFFISFQLLKCVCWSI